MPVARSMTGQFDNWTLIMNLDRLLLAAAVVAVAGFSIAPLPVAHAADKLGGNAVPGVCMLSREAVFTHSKVGEAATARLRQLAQQSNSQLTNQRTPLDTDIKTFQGKMQSMTQSERQKQGQALQQRMQTFQGQAKQTNEQLQLTRAKAMQRIGADAEPIVSSEYKGHHCGLLLDRDSVLGGNMANDLTSGVIQGLDRKITTITFNLEPLPSNSSNSSSK